MRKGGRRSGNESEIGKEIEIGTETESESETEKVKRRDPVLKIILKKTAKTGLSHEPPQLLRNTERSVKTPEPICSSLQLCLNTSLICHTCTDTLTARVTNRVTQDTEGCHLS